VADVGCTVPSPSLPSWAEMVKRGTTPPWGQPPPHPPPGPASRGPPPPSACILQLYRDCVARGIWAKLIFETRGGEEQFSFHCSPQPAGAATAAATRAAAGAPCRQGKKKRPPNQRRRERAKRRREAWMERRNIKSQASRATFAATAQASTMAASAAAPPIEGVSVDGNIMTATSSAAATEAAAAQEASATSAASEPAAVTSPAGVDIGAESTATALATAATATEALRERCKTTAKERRSSARASVLDQRRNSLVSETQISPEKIRAEEDMNESFRIQLEDDELQREEEEENPVAGEGAYVETPILKKQPPTPPPYSKFFPPTSHEVICRVCWQGRHTFGDSGFDRCYLCRIKQRNSHLKKP